MINFDQVRLSPGEPLVTDKWNGLLDRVKELPLSISSDGNTVGVGDSFHVRKLEVSGDIVVRSTESKAAMSLSVDASGTASLSTNKAYDSESPDSVWERTLSVKGGNVGIGTTSPKQRLHVQGDYYGRGHFWLYAYDGDGKSGTAHIQGRDDSGKSDIALQLRTQRKGKHLDVMRLGTTGNVGIGTTEPVGKLDITGGYMVMRKRASNSAAKAMLQKLPDFTLVIGGPSGDGIYLYWKSKVNNKSLYYRAIIKGQTGW